MMEDKISLMPIQALHTAAPFKTLFPIKESVLNEIAEDMKQNGFDYAHPIIIWGGHKVTVVDGHTRLAAAQKIHLNKVPVTLKEFTNEDEALRYAIRAQSNRRNLSDSELLACLNELDKRKERGGNPKASREAIGKSAEKTADILGISRAKVERLRTVNDHAPDSVKKAVCTGKMSVNKAYKATMAARQAKQHAEENSNSDIADIEKNKQERLEAIQNDIVRSIRKRLESELQEYPEFRYSTDEILTLSKNIQNKIQEIITAMLPGENEDEQ